MTIIEIACIVVGLVISYLVGSISPSIWIGRIFYNIDIRTKGSKNAGSTNTIRVLGLKAGIIVFIIDVIKGCLALFLANLFVQLFLFDSQLEIYNIAAAACVVLGHVFPIYEGFKGGKGVATMLGVLIYLYSSIFAILLAIFIIVFLIWRYISLGSITAAICFPITYYIHSVYWVEDLDPILFIFSIAVAIFIVYTHRKNIGRLLKGEEKKFKFKKTE
ncbi:MAG: glycerol-3-phosphate 1-O-acyltransferase PlsY [Bacteroidales bacterium]|mgnify:CR=1 FL=1|nr:glycerol-3-phosphate 1-O-acyltransferase PlsY [Bacteroidales bacterium]